jgi:uncharacterized membrane protein
MDDLLVALTYVTALGCGLSAGALFAFSSFVTKALARLQPAQGIAAMQSINVTAPMPPLMLLMFGTALAHVALIVAAVITLGEPFAPWWLAAAVVYLAGGIVVTMTYNVPRNNELAALDPGSAETAACWTSWVAEWTAGNHVRTVAGVTAAAALDVALHVA